MGPQGFASIFLIRWGWHKRLHQLSLDLVLYLEAQDANVSRIKRAFKYCVLNESWTNLKEPKMGELGR
jgi:hypothetical protein